MKAPKQAEQSNCVFCTLPIPQCICSEAPNLSDINADILFHPRELEKSHSTGRLLKHCCKASSNKWHRLNSTMETQYANHILVYPSNNPNVPHYTLDTLPTNKPLLILDGTWQETRKMLRQSPFLNSLPCLDLSMDSSHYTLRRNQVAHGSSTLETLAHILGKKGHKKTHEKLIQFLLLFQHAYKTRHLTR